MDQTERQQRYAQATELEAQGRINDAVAAFLAIDAIDDAARILIVEKRYAEAAKALLLSLNLPPGPPETSLPNLSSHARRRALHAAICYAKTGQLAIAARMFVAMGEFDRAIAMYKQAGDEAAAATLEQKKIRAAQPRGLDGAARKLQPADYTPDGGRMLEAAGEPELALEVYIRISLFGEGARLAQALGRTAQAGGLYRDAGRPYEAASCFLKVGDLEAALDCLTRVSRDDPRYHEAAILAIHAAHRTNHLDFTLENFLSTFLSKAPRTEREFEAFYLLGDLYVNHDFTQNAREAFGQIVDIMPDFRDAKERLAGLSKRRRGAAEAYEKILEDDLAFRGGAPARRRSRDLGANQLPELPELPDLPAAPSMDVKPRRRRPASEPQAPARAVQPTPQSGGDATQYIPPNVLRERAARNRAARQAANGPAISVPPQQGSVVAVGSHLASLSDSADMLAMSSGDADYEVSPLRDSEVYPEVSTDTQPSEEPKANGKRGPSKPFSGFETGMVLADRYRLEKKIGSGGMAVVYQAFDLELEELVAIKLFTREISDEKAVTRFKQELSLSRRLSHPNIIRLYDIGSWSGFRFISMELLVGKDLNNHLGYPMPLKMGVDWLTQAALGLQAAHDQGVIHRDIKPHNIFVCDDGTVKVMDFGIAKRQSAPGVTVGNMIAGTPDYMSPEQIAGFSSVTHSTDIYALGVVAYQMFTGTLPFTHKELLPLLMMHINDPVPPPTERHAEIPKELERIIIRLLAKRPEDRFASCRALADALTVFMARL